MKLLTRTPKMSAAEIAEARAAETRAEIERARQLAELRREQAAADRAARLAEEQELEAEKRRRAEQRRADRAAARARVVAFLAGLRTVAPLLVVNTSTVGAQGAYAYSETPEQWPTALRAACAVVYALAAETIALYVGWHAHDALLQRAYATAARLRRASYLIAGVFATLNYSHFSDGWEPTAFAVALGTLSLLSPWLWGLHTRRAQHVQLLREDLVDETGAVFDPARKRAFPFRSWAARRWSIDHNVRDPREAWDGYNAERRSRKAIVRGRRRAALPAGRVRTAAAVLIGRPIAVKTAGLDTVPEDVRALCDAVLAQVRGARERLTVGAAQTARLAIPTAPVAIPAPGSVATPLAIPVATQPPAILATPAATPTAPTGQANGHDGGQGDADLMAIAAAITDPAPVATTGQTVAIPSGQQVATTGGQTDRAPVAKTVAARVAKPRPARVTAVATSKAKAGNRQPDRYAEIRRIAARMPKATEAEIAEKAGCSVSTLRRALGKKS